MATGSTQEAGDEQRLLCVLQIRSRMFALLPQVFCTHAVNLY